MRFARKRRVGTMISVIPLVDVMLILLIFFMVTSTFLDLDMIPLVGGSRPAAELSTAPAADHERVAETGSLLVRLGADGRAYVAGHAVYPAALTGIVSVRVAARPSTPVLVLPSGAATTQALVSLMDAIANAGAQDVRIVWLKVQ